MDGWQKMDIWRQERGDGERGDGLYGRMHNVNEINGVKG